MYEMRTIKNRVEVVADVIGVLEDRVRVGHPVVLDRCCVEGDVFQGLRWSQMVRPRAKQGTSARASTSGNRLVLELNTPGEHPEGLILPETNLIEGKGRMGRRSSYSSGRARRLRPMRSYDSATRAKTAPHRERCDRWSARSDGA